MKSYKPIFLASANKHKIEELRQLLHPLGFDLKSTLDVENPEEVEEDRPDLRGNALKKARFWHEKTGLPALSDDTGLEVDALGGAPGVYSARYAGEDASYNDNVNKLLGELKEAADRSARFRTVIAYVTDDDHYFFEGVCEGEIIRDKRGEKGFGYDPVFVPEGYDQTFAELSGDEKNKISHRGRALQKFIEFISRSSPQRR
ncbi:RdgB/HAM1 family non-canonical purine NTP pyrophosphatase [Rhodohalobacter mucosus]|uniref:dITP/XTP pyrophosphatase n=1 Tax=Rhodohalobacter mucosus TaxID=2079485 RepID=A0A316TSW8_9BACT|nr:RdgB/HAM1 family non-canonical purine NTP pyrophosphatase [Rhodohalobacter mucosus]PWN05364.1 non-canonical purine NTP pyrophosphatase, RdgB/HAM1 family [Rhodohalobacter mucosus]